jgi:hypothetical protein
VTANDEIMARVYHSEPDAVLAAAEFAKVLGRSAAVVSNGAKNERWQVADPRCDIGGRKMVAYVTTAGVVRRVA